MEESSRQADSEESSSSSDAEGPRRVDMDVDSEPAAEETPADSITPDEREVSSSVHPVGARALMPSGMIVLFL